MTKTLVVQVVDIFYMFSINTFKIQISCCRYNYWIIYTKKCNLNKKILHKIKSKLKKKKIIVEELLELGSMTIYLKSFRYGLIVYIKLHSIIIDGFLFLI